MSEDIQPVPQGAIEAVFGWAEAVLGDDFPTMWRLTGPEFRLCEAQFWILANQSHPTLEREDRDELAHELAQIHSLHPLRPFFEQGRLDTARAQYLPPWPRERWSTSSHRRIVGKDLDVVLILDPEEVGSYIPPGDVVGPDGVKVYLNRFTTDGWQLVGIDYQVPVPGWPPSSGVTIER